MSVGSVELYVDNGGWGGDLVLADNGDLLLAVDTLDNPVATQQRLLRLIMTNPAINDLSTGEPISEGDDLEFPWYGSGIRAEVGQMITTDLLARVQASVLTALGTDPFVVQSPSPVVTVTTDNKSYIFLSVQVTLNTKRTVTLPTLAINLSNGTVSVAGAT